MEKYGKLQFNLDYYTEVLDLDYILDCFPEDNFTKKYRALNEAMIGLITDYRYILCTHTSFYVFLFRRMLFYVFLIFFQSTSTSLVTVLVHFSVYLS